LKIIIFNFILILGFIITISINSVFADSDFVLKLINVNTLPTISNLEIDGENVQEICPLNKCKLEFINSSFNPPKPNNMTIAHTIIFNLKDNFTNVDSVSLKKVYSEKFSEIMNSCVIYDVIESNEQKIYFCTDGKNNITRKSDSKTWYYDSIGIYDAIKNIYTVKGDLIDNPIY
jgi:hypothetical protein